MAQANAKTTRRSNTSSTSSRSKAKSRNGSKSNSKTKTSGARKTTSSSRSSKPRSSASRPSPSRNGRSTAPGAVESAAKSVGDVAKRAKTPLLAGGAALVGLAGTLIARSRLSGKSHSRGLSLPKLPKPNGDLKDGARSLSQNVRDVAKQAERISQKVGSVAKTIQTVSETADDAVKKA